MTVYRYDPRAMQLLVASLTFAIIAVLVAASMAVWP
jgi:hypothetical protein